MIQDIRPQLFFSYATVLMIAHTQVESVERENVKTIIVDKGPDSVDFKLLSMLNQGDIVITGDYGLAAMCLAKKGYVLTHNGKELTSDNIDQLLAFRYESAKIRRAGGRTKGPKKRTEENNLAFEMKFRQICERAILVGGGTAND